MIDALIGEEIIRIVNKIERHRSEFEGTNVSFLC